MRCPIITSLFLFLTIVSTGYGQEHQINWAEQIQLEKWLNDLTGSRSARREAEQKLSDCSDSFGAMPNPFSFTPHWDSAIREYRRQAKPLVPRLIEMLDSQDEKVAGLAMGILLLTGPDAKAAIPKLKAMMFDKKTYDAEVWPMHIFVTLLYVTPEYEPVTPLALEWIDAYFERLAKNHPAAITDFPMTQECPDHMPNCLSQQGMSLWTTGFFSEMIIPHLLAAGRTRVEVPSILQATDKRHHPFVRTTALSVLMTLQSEARDALPGLRKLLTDDESMIRYMAAAAILAIEQDAAAIPAITDSLKLPADERKEFEAGAAKVVSCGALRFKEILDDAPPELIPGITGMLVYGNAAHRRLGLIYLAEIGPAAKSAIPEIQKLRNDPDEETRRFAAKALNAINPQESPRIESGRTDCGSRAGTCCCVQVAPVCCVRVTATCCARVAQPRTPGGPQVFQHGCHR